MQTALACESLSVFLLTGLFQNHGHHQPIRFQQALHRVSPELLYCHEPWNVTFICVPFMIHFILVAIFEGYSDPTVVFLSLRIHICSFLLKSVLDIYTLKAVKPIELAI